MSASPKDFTAAKLKKMGMSSSTPGFDSDTGTLADDWGRKAAHDSSQFRRGGAVGGIGRKINLGRPGRANGGPVSGSLQRTLRTEAQTVDDEKKDAPRGRLEANIHDARPSASVKKLARGGRAGKGKTVVNVVVAPQGGDGRGAAPAPVMPPVMPPPAAPPRPPMPPPGAGPNVNVMPSAAAPLGAAGAPPPGVPPGLRRRGGRVVANAAKAGGKGKFPKSAPAKSGAADFGKAGRHDFGPGGTPAKAYVKQTHGSGGGLGRLDNARREA